MSLAGLGQAIIKLVVNNKYKILNKIIELVLTKFNISKEIGNKVSSTISNGNIEASVINELSNQVRSYAESEILKQAGQINPKSFCPTKSELIKIINLRNELIKTLTQVKRQVTLLNNTTQPLEPILNALETAVTLLKSAPIPSAVGGVGIPVGIITTAGDILSTTKTVISTTKLNVNALNTIKDYINNTIDQILGALKILDILIELCAEKISKDEVLASSLGTGAGIGTGTGTGTGIGTGIGTGTGIGGNTGVNDGNVGGTGTNNLLLNNLLNIEDSGLINQLQSPSSNDTNTYKGFKLEIVLDDKNNARFPKRYAVAKTPNGIVVLRGESSFASSVDVLLNEIKFIIDRDNLTI
jgi:hypothetical protein